MRRHNDPMPLDEARLRELWAAGATCKAIATELGCSAALISIRAKRIGLPRRNTSTASLPSRAIVSAYVDHGKTIEDIRDQLRATFPLVSAMAVGNVLRSRGVKIRKRGTHRCWMSQVGAAESVALARKGWLLKDIAVHLGLTVRQVSLRVRKVLGPTPSPRNKRLNRNEVLRVMAATGCYARAAALLGCHWSTVRYHHRRKAVAS